MTFVLELKFVRQNLKQIETSLKNRGETADLESFNHCDSQRKSLLFEIEDLRHRRNVVSEQIAAMKRNKEDADDLVVEMRQVADRIKVLEQDLSENEDKINHILFRIPNLPHPSVPIGKDSSENPVINKAGDMPNFDFEPQPHWILGENLKIFDFKSASKITGARFPLYLGPGARLESAARRTARNHVHSTPPTGRGRLEGRCRGILARSDRGLCREIRDGIPHAEMGRAN